MVPSPHGDAAPAQSKVAGPPWKIKPLTLDLHGERA
jgi:hypothetical protein